MEQKNIHSCLLTIVIVATSCWLSYVTGEPVKEVCYPKVGCFDLKFPWSLRPNIPLPVSPDLINTKFTLHLKGKSPVQIKTDDANGLRQSRYDGSKKTTMIVHGFRARTSEQWCKDMVKALLKKEDMNVITVDWSDVAWDVAWVEYPDAAGNIRVVGAEIALMIKFLHATTGAEYSNFHLIGHSLGAHTMSYAGSRVRGIARITGLDPAGPGFNFTNKEIRLDESDATYVDVIHTNQGILGTSLKSGHADFTVNDGVSQPGCDPTDKKNLPAEGNWCAHIRPLALFTISIKGECPFKGRSCESQEIFASGQCSDGETQEMGYESSGSGDFFLSTTDAEPFCVQDEA